MHLHSSAWSVPIVALVQMTPARGIDWTTFPWGAVLSATGVLTTALLLALVTYLSRYFTPVKETARIEEELSEKLDKLQALLERTQDRGEHRYATIEQLNGATERIGITIQANQRRLEEMSDRITEATTEARSAFNLSQATQANVTHLTQRLEDVISRGLDRLDKQVEEITRALRDGHK